AATTGVTIAQNLGRRHRPKLLEQLVQLVGSDCVFEIPDVKPLRHRIRPQQALHRPRQDGQMRRIRGTVPIWQTTETNLKLDWTVIAGTTGHREPNFRSFALYTLLSIPSTKKSGDRTCSDVDLPMASPACS